MTRRHLSITGDAGRSTVLLDGHEISGALERADVSFRGGHFPVAQLAVVVTTGEVDGQAVVTLPAETRALLIQLGWTPPPEDGS